MNSVIDWYKEKNTSCYSNKKKHFFKFGFVFQ